MKIKREIKPMEYFTDWMEDYFYCRKKIEYLHGFKTAFHASFLEGINFEKNKKKYIFRNKMQ